MKAMMAPNAKIFPQRPQVNRSGCLSVQGWRSAERKQVVRGGVEPAPGEDSKVERGNPEVKRGGLGRPG